MLIVLMLITVANFYSVNAEFYTYMYFEEDYVSKSYTGNVSLKSSSITVKQYGSYLDITETAIITPELAEVGYIADFCIEGRFQMPAKSTVVKLVFTDTSINYSSRIMPVYQSGKPVDSTLGNPLVDLQVSDNDNYRIRLNKVALGKNYQVSIRYLVPNSSGGKPVFNLNVLFHSNFENPKVIEFNYGESTGNYQYALKIGQNNFKLNKGDLLQIPYQTTFELIALKNAESMQHITSFEGGDYKGKYLLFNTSIPDTVLYELSKPIELVFLWRWNKPTCFLKKNAVYGTSSLSPYGSAAILQAKAISEMIETVTFTGNQAGMVHSIQYRKPEVFPLCKKNSSALGVLTGYLSQINENYFLNSGYYEHDYYPDDPKDTLTDSSRTDFLNNMNIVKGLYSNGQGIMKHLIILTCGPIRKTSDIITIEELEPLLKDVSVYSEGSLWKDVSFTNVQFCSLKRELIKMNSFMVPQFRPNSIILQVENSAKKYLFPLAANIPSFTFVAKSDSAWSPNLTWFGYDLKGNPFDTVSTVAKLYNAEQDTGLVKLWAADKQRISEKQEKEIEATYGVISSDYSMRIYQSFSDDTIKNFAPVYNYFARNVSNLKFNNKTRTDISTFEITKNSIRIEFTDNSKIQRIKIYSLSGKIIADINPESFISKSGGYIIPLEKILSSKVACMVLLKIEAKNCCWTKKIFIK